MLKTKKDHGKFSWKELIDLLKPIWTISCVEIQTECLNDWKKEKIKDYRF